MLLSSFDYHLPPELIAQNPVAPRDHSRLMVLNRKTDKIQHQHFYDLPKILDSNYVLVFNQSKVIPARLYGTIDNAKVEILLLKKNSDKTWECMVKPGRKFKLNSTIIFTPSSKILNPKSEILNKFEISNYKFQTNASFKNLLIATIISIHPDGTRTIQFNQLNKKLDQLIEIYGSAPLPPYIKNSKASPEQYQTIYAKEKGSVAAPTAGLHFTKNLFNQLNKKNIQQAFVTLHVGRGTFEPVKTNNIKNHRMHSEFFTLTQKTADFLNQAKKAGKKIIAVGTTSIRVLETCANNQHQLIPQSGETDIFIYPGYKFKFIDGIITNFHLPKSTLIMLVSAFAGKKLTFQAYKEAINQKYRFYSFGDAMLIL